MKGWRVVKAEGRFDSVGFVARQLMEGHGNRVWKSDCGSCTELHGRAQWNSMQCLFWHNTPTIKRFDCFSGVGSLCPERHLAETFWGEHENKRGCFQEAHVPLRSLEYCNNYSNYPLHAGWEAVNQPLNKIPSLLLEKILFWAGFKTKKTYWSFRLQSLVRFLRDGIIPVAPSFVQSCCEWIYQRNILGNYCNGQSTTWCHRAAGVYGCQIEVCLSLVVGFGWSSAFHEDLLMLRRPYFNYIYIIVFATPLAFRSSYLVLLGPGSIHGAVPWFSLLEVWQILRILGVQLGSFAGKMLQQWRMSTNRRMICYMPPLYRCRKNKLPTIKGQTSVPSIQKVPWLQWDEESTHSEICWRSVC